jgi:hypothetical protein
MKNELGALKVCNNNPTSCCVCLSYVLGVLKIEKYMKIENIDL